MIFYTGCVLWVLFSGNVVDDSSTLMGVVSGMAVAALVIAVVWWSVQRRAKRTHQ